MYHPDKNKSPDAERKFMAIAKAYVLTDPVAKELEVATLMAGSP